MTDRELEQKLEQALNHAAPNDMESVLSRCGARKGTVTEMTDVTMKDITRKNNSSKRWTRGFAVAMAVALVLIGGGGGMFYWQSRAVASIVSLDVNPSIELRLNRNGTVLSCTAMNEDAAAVLYEMGGGADLEGIKLDVAVNAIVGALLRHGYLDSISSAILISVEDSDQGRAARIQEELVTVVDTALQRSSSQSAVYSQKMTVDAGIETQAQNSNISSGKAYMVNQIIALNSALEFEALAALSVEELRDLIKIDAPGMPIGMDAAAIAAEEYAGTDVLNSDVVHDVDPELDDTIPHYEVELYLPGRGEFEYRIDAFTGAVLSGQPNILDTAQPQTPAGSGAGSQPQAPGNNGVIGSSGIAGSNGTGSNSDIGSDAARAAALAHAGLSESQVSRMKVKQDWDDGRLEYEVEFFYNDTEYDYTIDGVTGEVRGYDIETVKGSQSQEPSGGGSTDNNGTASGSDIGADAAKAAALTHAGFSESQVSHLKVKRDWDDGRLEYEVEFKCGGYEYEYTVNGANGAILEHEMEKDD